MTKIIRLTPDTTLKHWPVLSGFLAPAIEHGEGESTITDYMRKVLAGIAHCWLILDDDEQVTGAGLTEFIHYLQYKSLHVIAYGGSDFAEQSKVFDTIKDFARENGCKNIQQWGRPGWAKQLPKYVPGFKQSYVVMTMELGEPDEK